MAKIDHFDLISPLYDLVFGQRIDDKIIEFTDLGENQRLLDVGGGTGRVSALFKNKIKQAVIADASMNMLKEAQQKGLITLNANSESLPFSEGFFDRIIIVDALHHVENQEQTLKEMWRVLKSGGRLIVEEPDINNFLVKLIALGEKILLMRSHFISPQEIAKMCHFNGQANVEIKKDKGNAWIIIEKNPTKASERNPK